MVCLSPIALQAHNIHNAEGIQLEQWDYYLLVCLFYLMST